MLMTMRRFMVARNAIEEDGSARRRRESNRSQDRADENQEQVDRRPDVMQPQLRLEPFLVSLLVDFVVDLVNAKLLGECAPIGGGTLTMP